MSSGENVEWLLICAARNGSLEDVQRHLSSGVNVNCRRDDLYGPTPLYLASINGHTELVKLLLKYNADPNISNKDGWIPLHVAGNEVIAEYLINSGANINTLEDEYGCTPLYWTSINGRTEIVKLLLKYNADPNISNKDGQTPLHVAGNEVIAECLINSGANIDTLEDEYGCTPLYWTSINGHTKIVKLLLTKPCNANPNISDKDGEIPLHVAGNEVIAECLINSGVDINTLDKDSCTPLYWASHYGHIEVVKVLLKYNADPNISNKYLNTALHVACERAHKGVVECLVENGASVDARNKDDKTPIDILKKPFDDEIAERRRYCLEWLKEMGYLEDTASAVPIADLSTEISSSSPSIDKMDSYGLSLDVDPSLLSNRGSPILADIKVFTVDDDDEVSNPSFTFPEETKPVSAVYTISLSDTHVPPRTLRIRHCADPNNPEELEQLIFVKSSNDSSSKFEVVPGGIFKPGEQYGEITPPHMCSWSIVGRIKKFVVDKARYVGTILYQTVRQHPNVWIMQLLVAKHDSTSILALNEYINNKYGHDVVKEPEFLFTFENSDKPKLGLATANDERVLKCSNGWEISLDMYEISQDTIDRFKRPTDVQGRCSLKIHTHGIVCHELSKLPFVTLNGINSDRKDIQINPPQAIPDGAADHEFERDYTNVKPELKSRRDVPTLEDVFDRMKCYSAKWDDFGRALRIPFNDRQLLHDERISAETRLERVIYQWIESQCSPVTWDNLIDVCRRMGLPNAIPQESQPKSHIAAKPKSIPEPNADGPSSSYLTSYVIIFLVVLLAIGVAAYNYVYSAQ